MISCRLTKDRMLTGGWDDVFPDPIYYPDMSIIHYLRSTSSQILWSPILSSMTISRVTRVFRSPDIQALKDHHQIPSKLLRSLFPPLLMTISLLTFLLLAISAAAITDRHLSSRPPVVDWRSPKTFSRSENFSTIRDTSAEE